MIFKIDLAHPSSAKGHPELKPCLCVGAWPAPRGLPGSGQGECEVPVWNVCADVCSHLCSVAPNSSVHQEEGLGTVGPKGHRAGQLQPRASRCRGRLDGSSHAETCCGWLFLGLAVTGESRACAGGCLLLQCPG